MRRTAILLLLLAWVTPGSPAGAFETDPWDGTAFDAALGMSAAAHARMAGAIALGEARAVAPRFHRSAGVTTAGQSGCTVNIGGVTLPAGSQPQALSVTTSAVVTGNVITVCR